MFLTSRVGIVFIQNYENIGLGASVLGYKILIFSKKRKEVKWTTVFFVKSSPAGLRVIKYLKISRFWRFWILALSVTAIR
jgi:hypothetical protein